MVWTLSGFIDEISKDFTEQCKVASDLGMHYVQVRSAWGTNILDLDSDQLATVRETLAESGPELFTQAWKAFTDLLTSEGIEYA
jgi:hypothetical protein